MLSPIRRRATVCFLKIIYEAVQKQTAVSGGIKCARDRKIAAFCDASATYRAGAGSTSSRLVYPRRVAGSDGAETVGQAGRYSQYFEKTNLFSRERFSASVFSRCVSDSTTLRVFASRLSKCFVRCTTALGQNRVNRSVASRLERKVTT